MNASQFAKAQKLFDRIKELDAEILICEKCAKIIADKSTEIKLSLKLNDIEAAAKEKNKVTFDEDGSLSYGLHKSLMQTMFGYVTITEKQEKEKKYTDRWDCEISDRVALKVLGVLLADKLEIRELAIKQLGKMGIII